MNKLVLNQWDQKNGILEIRISCSSGTYIRAIARDLGKLLDSEGCLLNLKRISACGFHENKSVKISDLINSKDNKKSFIIPTISALEHIPTIVLSNAGEINFWRTGRVINLYHKTAKNSRFDHKKPIKIIDTKACLLGIGFVNEENNKLHPKLVLNAK